MDYWNELTLMEQLSNIDGEVKRLVDAREDFLTGKKTSDHFDFYIGKIEGLVRKTIDDPKNRPLRIDKELWDEIDEIKRYYRGEVSKDYILEYWHPYTKAIS